MLPRWTLAASVLLAAGVAEFATGLANRMSLLSLLLGGATVAVAAVTLRVRKGRFDGGAWFVAVLGSCLAFRAFVYEAPLLALVLVTLSGMLYVSTLVLAFAAWREEVQRALT